MARVKKPNNHALYLFDGLAWDEADILDGLNLWVSDWTDFFVTSPSKLGIATLDGMVVFDGQEWRLLDSDFIPTWLVQTSDDRLWSQSWRSGLVSFDGRKWQEELNFGKGLIGNPLIGNRVLATSTDKILIANDEGLFQYDPALQTLTDLKLGKVNVRQIYQARNQLIWVATDAGLYQLGEQKWQRFLTDQSVATIKQDVDGQLWVGGSLGLYRFDGSSWQQKTKGNINCIYQLDNKMILAGSDTGLWVESSIDKQELIISQPQAHIIGISQATNDVIWFRSDQGIFSYDGLSWTIHNQSRGNWEGGLIGLKSGVYEAADGSMWFNDGLIYSYKDGTWESHVRGAWSVGVTTTSDGRFWGWGGGLTGDGGGGGATWYSAEDEKWISAVETSGYVYDFIESPEGKYWIGTWNNITAYFDADRWIEVPISGGGEISFFEDGEGTLWATGNGIYRWQESDQQWLQVTGDEAIGAQFRAAKKGLDGTWRIMSDGVPIFGTFDGKKLAVHSSSGQGNIRYRNVRGDGFTEYPAGVFWLATDSGLRRIQGDTWYDLTVADGLPSDSVWCVMADNQGYLWVGTEKGAVRYKPPTNLQPPAVKIRLVDGEEIPDDKVYLTGRSFLKIDWYGGDLQSPDDRLVYQYGINGQWSEMLRQNTATVGLVNGEHKFVLRAIDHHFNASAVDSMTIIIKTEDPYVTILNPNNGDIVSGEFYIKGQIKDDDFAAFQVFLSDLVLTETPVVEEEDAEANLQKPYQLIFDAEGLPRTATLAKLNTKQLDDGDYQIWLTAQDELGHANFEQVVFRVDNAQPSVKILTPNARERVLKHIQISATISDMHLDKYRLDFSTNLAGKSWEQIYLEAGLYTKSEDALLPKPELQTININRDWEIPILEGSVWIRLTATDIAGDTNSQTIQIEVPTAVVTRKGGTIAPEDQQAELYLPPNTLAQDTIVTVNALTETEVEPPVRRVSQIYDFAPATLRLNSIKPATLTISYDASQLSTGKEPVIFHRTDGLWKAVGSTPNPEQQTISPRVYCP